MHNVIHEIKGDELILRVKIGKEAINAAPPSSSGKTNLVASTGGYAAVNGGGGLSFSLNVTAKRN